MPINQRQFFTTKPKVVEYTTLTLSHPAFGDLRYVGNQYFDVTLGGIVYEPAAMSITESLQDERGLVSYDVQLGRVGLIVADYIKLVDQYPLGWVIGIDATVAYYLSSDTSTPYRTPVTLSVGSLSIDRDAVSMSLDTANPRNEVVARRYNGDDFPGTKVQV